MTPALRRAGLLFTVVVGVVLAGLFSGSSFFFAADRQPYSLTDEEVAERVRRLRLAQLSRGAGDGSGELHPLLMWPIRILIVAFVLAVVAAVGYGLVQAVRGLRALRRLLALRARADREGEDYVDHARSDDDAVTALRRRLRQGLDVGVEQLDASAPAREVVIACYQGLQRAAADAGTAPAPADTPTELVLRVLAAHSVPAVSARTLVALYEQARFSPHAVDDTMRADARRCLDDVRSCLATT